MDAVIIAEDTGLSTVSLPQLLSDLFMECLTALTGQFSQSGRGFLAQRQVEGAGIMHFHRQEDHKTNLNTHFTAFLKKMDFRRQ